MFLPIVGFISAVLFAPHAIAQCQASNLITDPNAPLVVETDPQLCLPQGEGAWTFAMTTSLDCVPALSDDPSNNLAGCADGNAFFIFDNACNTRGAYNAPDCGYPPWIIEENFLADVLTIKSVDFDTGDPYFQFAYGDGLYSINNNQCGCQAEYSGPGVTHNCKCAFPVSGV